MKTIILSRTQIAAIKRTAQNVNPLVKEKQKALATIEECQKTIELLDAQINGNELGVKALCTVGTEDLVEKVITNLGVDANGKKQTKIEWKLKPCIKYNEEKGNYTLTIMEDGDIADPDFENNSESESNFISSPLEEQTPADDVPMNNAEEIFGNTGVSFE